jgi:hypothetical protein
MTFEEFVAAYHSKQVAAHIDRSLALQLMEASAVAKRYRAAHLLWTWVWFLSIPAAIVLIIWVNWWVGLIVLLIGFALPRAIKQSATQFVLEQALEDKGFYELAVKSGALRITSDS